MAKFELLEASGPNWAGIDDAVAKQFFDSLADQWLVDPSGRRYGFREVTVLSPTVAWAFFAVQSQLPYWSYDSSGKPEHHYVPDSYERVLSLFLLRDGRFLLHERRFFRTDLNKERVRALWFEVVARAMANAQLGPLVRLEPYEREVSREEMADRLEGEPGRVVEIDIGDLAGHKIPISFRFFNPDFDKDAAVRAILDSGLETIDDARFVAAANADARRARVVQGLAEAGTVEEYVVVPAEGGKRRTVRIRISSTIDIDIDTELLEEPNGELIELLVERISERFPDRYPLDWTGTIFEGSQGLGDEAEDGDDGST